MPLNRTKQLPAAVHMKNKQACSNSQQATAYVQEDWLEEHSKTSQMYSKVQQQTVTNSDYANFR